MHATTKFNGSKPCLVALHSSPTHIRNPKPISFWFWSGIDVASTYIQTEGVPNKSLQIHKGYLSKSAFLQYIAGAQLCGSKNLLPAYWFGLAQKTTTSRSIPPLAVASLLVDATLPGNAPASGTYLPAPVSAVPAPSMPLSSLLLFLLRLAHVFLDRPCLRSLAVLMTNELRLSS